MWPFTSRRIAAQLAKMENKIMATLADIQASQAAEDDEIKSLISAFQAEQTAIAANTATIASLQAQIAAGAVVSAADLDKLKADMDAQSAAMAAVLPAPVAAPAT